MQADRLTRRAAWILAICAVLTNLVSFLDRQTLAYLAPAVRHDLHIGQGAYGWLAAAFFAAYLLSGPLAGQLLDRFGARRGLIVSVLAWSVISGLHAIVPSFAALLALRIALGVAESPALPGGAQVIVRALPERDRPRGLGLLFVGSAIGAAIAAPVATRVAKAWSWHVAFVVTAAAGLLWLPIWFAAAWRRSARAVLDRPPGHARAASLRDILDKLRDPVILRGAIVVLLVSPAVAFSALWGAELLVTDHGLRPFAVGHYLWLPPLGVDAGSLLFGDLAARRARARGGRPDHLLFVIAIALVAGGAWLAAFAWGPWAAVAGTATMMFGCAGVYVLMLAEMTPRAPGAVALVTSFVTGSQALAFIIANPLIGRVAQQRHTYFEVLLVIGALAIAAGATWLVRGTRRSRAG